MEMEHFYTTLATYLGVGYFLCAEDIDDMNTKPCYVCNKTAGDFRWIKRLDKKDNFEIRRVKPVCDECNYKIKSDSLREYEQSGSKEQLTYRAEETTRELLDRVRAGETLKSSDLEGLPKDQIDVIVNYVYPPIHRSDYPDIKDYNRLTKKRSRQIEKLIKGDDYVRNRMRTQKNRYNKFN